MFDQPMYIGQKVFYKKRQLIQEMSEMLKWLPVYLSVYLCYAIKLLEKLQLPCEQEIGNSLKDTTSICCSCIQSFRI